MPAYKVGGPVQSIANLCRELRHEFKFYIVCSDTDHNEIIPLINIQSNAWNNFEDGVAEVYYLSKNQKTIGTIKKIAQYVQPDYVFVNGIFLLYYSFLSLLYTSSRQIISARGMLHPGALSQKKLKKKLFILLFKLFRLHKKVLFHATDFIEKPHIQNIFGEATKVAVAQNFPKRNITVKEIKKEVNELRLITVAVISPVKNHIIILESLKGVKARIYYDVFGPVTDKNYWHACTKIIAALPQNITVRYHGNLQPDKVTEKISSYHCFILPSKSENFGHAIYEALISGRPVITSNYTPWVNLKENKAGWNVNITDVKNVTNAIEEAASFNNVCFQEWSTSSVKYAANKVDFDSIKQQYRELFNQS